MDTVKKTAERESLKYESLCISNVNTFYFIFNMESVIICNHNAWYLPTPVHNTNQIKKINGKNE